MDESRFSAVDAVSAAEFVDRLKADAGVEIELWNMLVGLSISDVVIEFVIESGVVEVTQFKFK